MCYIFINILDVSYFDNLNKIMTKNFLIYDCNQLFDLLESEEIIIPGEKCNKLLNEIIEKIENNSELVKNKFDINEINDNFQMYFETDKHYYDIKNFSNKFITDEKLKSVVEFKISSSTVVCDVFYRFMLIQKYISYMKLNY